MSTPLNRPIIQLKENPISQKPVSLLQPKKTSKVPISETSQIHDKIIPIPDYMIQVLEWSKEKPHGILVGKFQSIQILFIDPS